MRKKFKFEFLLNSSDSNDQKCLSLISSQICTIMNPDKDIYLWSRNVHKSSMWSDTCLLPLFLEFAPPCRCILNFMMATSWNMQGPRSKVVGGKVGDVVLAWRIMDAPGHSGRGVDIGGRPSFAVASWVRRRFCPRFLPFFCTRCFYQCPMLATLGGRPKNRAP